MDFIALAEQQLRQIGAVLACDAGNQCFLHRVSLPLLSVKKAVIMALHGLSEKLPEKKHPRNRLDAYFSG
jgi:hypothetical protein